MGDLVGALLILSLKEGPTLSALDFSNTRKCRPVFVFNGNCVSDDGGPHHLVESVREWFWLLVIINRESPNFSC